MKSFLKGAIAGALLSTLVWTFVQDNLGTAFVSFILGAIAIVSCMFISAALGQLFEKAFGLIEKI